MDINSIDIIIVINIMASFFDIYVFIYYRYLKSCISKGRIKNSFIKQVRLKAENCKKIQLLVDDKVGFVEKILFRQKICGIDAKRVERTGSLLRLIAVILLFTEYNNEKVAMFGTGITMFGFLFREVLNVESLRLEVERQIVKECFGTRNEIRMENVKKEEVVMTERIESTSNDNLKRKLDLKQEGFKQDNFKRDELKQTDATVLNSEALLESILQEYF